MSNHNLPTEAWLLPKEITQHSIVPAVPVYQILLSADWLADSSMTDLCRSISLLLCLFLSHPLASAWLFFGLSNSNSKREGKRGWKHSDSKVSRGREREKRDHVLCRSYTSATHLSSPLLQLLWISFALCYVGGPWRITPGLLTTWTHLHSEFLLCIRRTDVNAKR